MFYWSRYRYHGNTAGSKPALNNGFNLFQKIQSLDFFRHLSLENSDKYWPIYTGLVRFWQSVFCILTFSEHFLCQILIFVCRHVKRVLNYYSIKFHEILTSSSVEISAFPLKRAVTIFWLTAHALHLTGFSIFLILVPRAYDLFCQRWDRRALVSAITGCREIHDIR